MKNNTLQLIGGTRSQSTFCTLWFLDIWPPGLMPVSRAVIRANDRPQKELRKFPWIFSSKMFVHFVLFSHEDNPPMRVFFFVSNCNFGFNRLKLNSHTYCVAGVVCKNWNGTRKKCNKIKRILYYRAWLYSNIVHLNDSWWNIRTLKSAHDTTDIIARAACVCLKFPSWSKTLIQPAGRP